MMERTADDMVVLGNAIYESFSEIIKEARCQEDVDAIWDDTMEWISENFVVVFFGDSPQSSEQTVNE